MMMDKTPVAPDMVQKFRAYRRKKVKAFGKKLIRGLASFLGQQARVGDMPVFPDGSFPALRVFEERWQDIQHEVKDILRYREDIPLFQDVSKDQMKIAKGTNWRTFILYGFGAKLEKNCKQAPITAALLAQVPNLQTAWFSIIAPGYHIPPHRGVTKGILRAHLGLLVPRDFRRCYIRVDQEIKSWEAGKLFVFDDTYEHEVFNATDEERVILLFDFDRPMSWRGRLVNSTFLRLMKLTAYYQEPKRNMATFEDRFEAATRRASENIENLSDHD
jgi:ornithine lipid ester-linked acyl 2-hydroxylase